MFQKIKKIIKIETNASIFIYISSKIEKYLLHFCTKLKKFLYYLYYIFINSLFFVT